MSRPSSIPIPRPLFIPLFLFAAAISAACGKGKPALKPVPQAAVVYDDDAGGVRDSLRLVVRDAAALGSLWRNATRGQSAPLPPPQVDFRREMVLAVAAGRMSANDRIRVDSVGVRKEPGADGKMREVLSVLVLTTQGCRTFATPVFPVQLVRVPRYEGQVRFVERREQGEGCGRE
ncbi:MAG TPA: hypothetical protein VF092_26510 [Longimicrobium sp.]